ncbi:MAG: plasmid stabilization system [Methanocalculus sp. MSAO_Arc2]|nr:MAG: plasmid stabilization system [Methanocalculus sp. MSAO_Arc2]
MHVSRTYTLIFRNCPDQSRIRVVEILPIDLAHKRYFRYR